MCIYRDTVDDFIDSATTEFGCGCFEGVEIAVKFAQSLSRNARQKCRRYGIVPRQFFQCLQAMGILDATQVPACGVNMKAAKAILEEAGLRERLSYEDFFESGLYIQSGTQQHLWRRIMNQFRPKARPAA